MSRVAVGLAPDRRTSVSRPMSESTRRGTPEMRARSRMTEFSISLSRISGVPRLVDSLIGRDTEVHRTETRPHATRLTIGDHCSVDLE